MGGSVLNDLFVSNPLLFLDRHIPRCGCVCCCRHQGCDTAVITLSCIFSVARYGPFLLARIFDEVTPTRTLSVKLLDHLLYTQRTGRYRRDRATEGAASIR